MHVDALGGKAGEERTRQEKRGVDGGVDVDAEGGPVVLVLEIVKDLGGKSKVVGGVCGWLGWIWHGRGNGCRIHISVSMMSEGNLDVE